MLRKLRSKLQKFTRKNRYFSNGLSEGVNCVKMLKCSRSGGGYDLISTLIDQDIKMRSCMKFGMIFRMTGWKRVDDDNFTISAEK